MKGVDLKLHNLYPTAKSLWAHGNYTWSSYTNIHSPPLLETCSQNLHRALDRPRTPVHLPTAPTLTHTRGEKEREGGREEGRERTNERKSLCLHRTQSPACSLRVMPEGTVPSWPPCVAQTLEQWSNPLLPSPFPILSAISQPFTITDSITLTLNSFSPRRDSF